jgi:hypothetical protein
MQCVGSQPPDNDQEQGADRSNSSRGPGPPGENAGDGDRNAGQDSSCNDLADRDQWLLLNARLLQPRWERERGRGRVTSDVELDHRMASQRNRAGISGDPLTDQIGGYLTAVGGHPITRERLAPDIEVVAEREGTRDGRFDMD